jgi:DNA-binding LacI/PurR family transcriptional regulator
VARAYQETTFEKRGGYSKTVVLLRLIPRPTSIFAGNDMIALGSLLAIREAGLTCPKDISLTIDRPQLSLVEIDKFEEMERSHLAAA